MATGGDAATTTTTGSLQLTPTWALATVCFIFISLSIFMEHLINLLSRLLKKHRKAAFFDAVEKLKSVLMVLGFMSLILTVTQKSISKICIPNKFAYSMLPCRKMAPPQTTNTFQISLQERMLTSGSPPDYCESKEMTSFMSQNGLNQLKDFIFVLAVMQIVYSVSTMALGRAKMRRWKSWERETLTVEYQAANDPNRFRLTKQTTFGRRHMSSFTSTSLLLWIKCFFRQFFHSVAKVDYLTLRHGFISAHFRTKDYFDFQKYIERSLEDDFKVVVGISPIMWFIVVIFMLVDVHGSDVYLWVSFLPLIIVLVLGTKLEVIVARMALQLKDQNSVVIKGALLVQPNDNLFWFSHPKFILFLLHYTLFVNAFEVGFFVWVTLQFGIKSCYHERIQMIIVRVVLAVTVQVMCSYITLPLYALVTQMGSNFKSAILEEQTVNAIKQWHNDVRQKKKKQDTSQSSRITASNVLGSYSSRTISSPDISTHHRTPTFSDMAPMPSKTEICEDNQEFGHNDPHMVTSHVLQIELTDTTKTQSNFN
ncbi:Mlo domain-containing protein [Cephalotus follicularis]|uniref:MLO-like protein n=1 Tax=Cephalotus follicularis TaxID=3775 RepID=A0A1Q3CD20_CEPFO|nr:Mlo domain-containing protein [Cephalotus follicularis]